MRKTCGEKDNGKNGKRTEGKKRGRRKQKKRDGHSGKKTEKVRNTKIKWREAQRNSKETETETETFRKRRRHSDTEGERHTERDKNTETEKERERRLSYLSPACLPFSLPSLSLSYGLRACVYEREINTDAERGQKWKDEETGRATVKERGD